MSKSDLYHNKNVLKTNNHYIFENGNFSSEINSAMTYKECLKAIQTIRYCFESKLIKKQFYKKLLHTLY